jgi:hypothetical protein
MGMLVRDVSLKPLLQQRLSGHYSDRQSISPEIPILPLRFQFDVYHGRVMEVLIGQVPFVHGEGRSFAGFGRSCVTTEVIKETSVWLRNHQTGQEERFDLVDADLLARAGHDVTLLWVNRQLYAIHNYSTGQTTYFDLHPSIAPFRKERFRGFAGLLLVLLGVPFFGVTALPLALGLCAFPLLAALGQPKLWTARVVDPYIAAATPFLILALMIFTAALIFLRNRKARAYNCAVHRELERQIHTAMTEHVFSYRVARPI